MRYLLLLLLLVSCKELQYESDITFISPLRANYPDYFVKVNNYPCVDLLGSVGLCAIKQPETNDINIKILPQDYSYTFDFRCGTASGIIYRKQVDVLKKAKFEFNIPKEDFKDKRYLNCIGDIFPHDRDGDVSSFFEIRFRIYSKLYIRPPEIYDTFYRKKKVLVLGKHAYKSKVLIGGKWYYLNKQTVFKHKGKIDFAVMETHNMRRSYYGFFK